MSHYFGFGALSPEIVKSPSGKITSQESSNKFQERLKLRQKEIEVSKFISLFC
jgi:hypothetical protein